MLYYDKTDLSEKIDVAKSSNSKECIVCHYWFFNHGSEFQDSVCNGCHDLTMLPLKCAASGRKPFMTNESALKMTKKCFLFHLKNSIRS